MTDAALLAGLRAGGRRELARAITLVESTLPEHQARARGLLAAAWPFTGGALRVGISGAPGVGKSTFIEALGVALCAQGHRVAVLAVDPSSSISGGSILGDKTRMERLTLDERAFIRPSPTAGSLGGVAARTREAMLLCEAAGYDVVLVETVGVGQSEIAVHGMVDTFVLLQLPNAGDDLQGIKRGIVELADVVVVNKLDLDRDAGERAMGQLRSALGILRAGAAWVPPVLGVAALRDDGIAAVWQAVQAHQAAQSASGEHAARRRRQAVAWMHAQIDDGIRATLFADAGVVAERDRLATRVAAGDLDPALAAATVLARLFAG